MSREVPDVVVYALVVAVTVGVVAAPVSALGDSTTTATMKLADGDGATGPVVPQTTNQTVTEEPNDSEPNDSEPNESLAPGQQLAGVVGVQGAEIDGEIGERTLATRASRAESNASKAAVVATEINTVRNRLHDLRDRQSELREARQSGEISTGEYRARMAVTAAQIRAVQTRIESTEQVSRDLPADELEASGVNREELDRLREDADELSGPEVAEIAQEVAGEDAGRGFAPDRGPGELPEPARDDEDESANGQENVEAGEPPVDPGNGDGPDAAGNRSNESDPGNGDGPDAAGNRSNESDSPQEAGGADDGESSGNSDEAGSGESSGNSDEAGSGESSGNSGDAGESGGGGSGGSDSAGNSGTDGASDGGPDDAGNGGGNR